MELDSENEIFNDAVTLGTGTEQFDWARKLLSLAIVLGKEFIAPEAAAKTADAAVFEKAAEHAVGNGEISDEDGAELIVDRLASAVVTVIKPVVKQVVTNGLGALAAGACAFLGAPQLAPLAYVAGRTLGEHLAEPVAKVVEAGAKRLFGFIKDFWNDCRKALTDAFETAVETQIA